MFNSERTAELRDFAPDTHPERVFWQGSRVNGVTGTKALTAEPVVDQKVRIQSHCSPKLQRLFVYLFRALVLPCKPSDYFLPLTLSFLAECDAQGKFFLAVGC